MTAAQGLAVACAAAVAASAGDLTMLLVANAAHFGLALPRPYGLLGVGAALGVGCIPVYAIGYFAAARALCGGAAWAAWSVRLGGVIAPAIGCVIHALTAAAIFAQLQSGSSAASDPLAAVAQIPALAALWGAAAASFALACLPLAWCALRGSESWALANPLLGALVLAALGATFELGRFFLVPAAPNLAHAVFFASAALHSRGPR